MKSFACGDVVPGCSARWEEPSEDALVAHVAEHAGAVHGLVEVPPELVEAVRAAIRPVTAPTS
jgi:predicted small metal-binding protein